MVVSILQVVGLARYISRLPDDWVGIGLYIATIIGFLLAGMGFTIQWRQEKCKEEPE
ncbi:MAG TPA: hypothetical protein G4O06_08755 [Dehalococcoidia bacterium]|nr:hypothetical protein [Dehalococcoidia bacterium]